MTSQSPVRDFLLPRITALVNDTVAAGAERDVVVAVIIDIITSPLFDTAAPDPKADSAPHADYDRAHDGGVVLVNGTTPANVQNVGVQAEDDFIAPLTFRD
jgi:hypothetical protein